MIVPSSTFVPLQTVRITHENGDDDIVVRPRLPRFTVH